MSSSHSVFIFVLVACLAMLHVTEAACPSAGRRRLMATASHMLVLGPNPNPGTTNLNVELAFNERSNRVVASTAMGSYAHFVHEQEHTTSCTSQVEAATRGKAAVEPRPRWHTTWVPELLESVHLDITSTKTCAAPALSDSSDDFFHSRLDVGNVMNSENSEVQYDNGSCTVALSVRYDGPGCGCLCFEGKATVSFRQVEAGTREVLTCSELHRDPALGCRCTMCPKAVA